MSRGPPTYSLAILSHWDKTAPLWLAIGTLSGTLRLSKSREDTPSMDHRALQVSENRFVSEKGYYFELHTRVG